MVQVQVRWNKLINTILASVTSRLFKTAVRSFTYNHRTIYRTYCICVWPMMSVLYRSRTFYHTIKNQHQRQISVIIVNNKVKVQSNGWKCKLCMPLFEKWRSGTSPVGGSLTPGTMLCSKLIKLNPMSRIRSLNPTLALIITLNLTVAHRKLVNRNPAAPHSSCIFIF